MTWPNRKKIHWMRLVFGTDIRNNLKSIIHTTKSEQTSKTLLEVDSLHHARQTNGQQQLHSFIINSVSFFIAIFYINGSDVHTLQSDYKQRWSFSFFETWLTFASLSRPREISSSLPEVYFCTRSISSRAFRKCRIFCSVSSVYIFHSTRGRRMKNM